MEDRKQSISPNALYARLGSESAPIIVDVRRDADFADAEKLVADAAVAEQALADGDARRGRSQRWLCLARRELRGRLTDA